MCQKKINQSPVPALFFHFPFPFSFSFFLHYFKEKYSEKPKVGSVYIWLKPNNGLEIRESSPSCTTTWRNWGILWAWDNPDLWSLRLNLVFPEPQKSWKVPLSAVIDKRIGKIQSFPAEDRTSPWAQSCLGQTKSLSLLNPLLPSFSSSSIPHSPYVAWGVFLDCIPSGEGQNLLKPGVAAHSLLLKQPMCPNTSMSWGFPESQMIWASLR